LSTAYQIINETTAIERCVITTLHKKLKSSNDYNVRHILYCEHNVVAEHFHVV